jgi:hypothetical protein
MDRMCNKNASSVMNGIVAGLAHSSGLREVSKNDKGHLLMVRYPNEGADIWSSMTSMH